MNSYLTENKKNLLCKELLKGVYDNSDMFFVMCGHSVQRVSKYHITV